MLHNLIMLSFGFYAEILGISTNKKTPEKQSIY